MADSAPPISSANYPNPPELRSRYIDPEQMAWQPSDFPGIETKVLWADAATGRSTILFKLAPGAVVPPHEHADVEQTWVLSGTFEDHEGTALPGHYIWRPGGNRHEARSVDGAVILSMFAAPNRFDAGSRFYTDDDQDVS
ncbi:MAG: cupin domain-containing protein [Acidimicrobiales bacterium]